MSQLHSIFSEIVLILLIVYGVIGAAFSIALGTLVFGAPQVFADIFAREIDRPLRKRDTAKILFLTALLWPDALIHMLANPHDTGR